MRKQYIQTEDTDFVREFSSRGLVNVNKREYESYITMRNKLKNVDKLEQEVAEMKSMLSEILGRKQ